MQFSVWGVSYQETPLSLRDKASFSDTQKLEALERLSAAGIAQAAILSTCNRSEIYYMAPEDSAGEAVRAVFLEKEPALGETRKCTINPDFGEAHAPAPGTRK